jgi:hypothetical protein
LKIHWLAPYFPQSLALFKVFLIFLFDVPEILYFFAIVCLTSVEEYVQ